MVLTEVRSIGVPPPTGITMTLALSLIHIFWRVPEQTNHREVLRALWAAGYVPIEFRSHELSGLPFREQHWLSPDGTCRVLYQFTIESPIPVRLIPVSYTHLDVYKRQLL